MYYLYMKRNDSMKISTKGRYAVRFMLDLAMASEGEYVPLKAIAARQDISVKYLEQIVNSLNKAGLVRSVRGTQGGYRMAVDPKDCTVGMILRLTEGSLSCVSCLEYEPNECTRAESCLTLPLWQKLNEAINSVVDNVTIADLMNSKK
jgi:Rrf2 family protein